MRKFIVLVLLMTVATSIVAQESKEHEKISPYLESLICGEDARDIRRAPSTETQTITLLAKLAEDADEEELAEKYGFEVLSRIGRVLVLRMPKGSVAQMAADNGVVRLEAERMPRPMLDLVPQQIGVDKVHDGLINQLPQAYTGKNVVVGIVDSGFDYINPFFRDENGVTRIQWAADYINNKKYSGTDEVTTAMHSSDASTMYHGTHVAGIAAGSRVQDSDWDPTTSKTYQGIASEADIAEGAINSEITSSGLSSATSIQAFADIFEYADQQNKPCVINYSLGDAMSFADTRQLEEEAIRTLLEKPGHVLVVASGNAGSTSRLAHKPADMTEGGCGVCFNDWEQYGTYFGIELKVKTTQSITLRYTNSSYSTYKGTQTIAVESLIGAKSFSLGSKQIQVYLKEQTDDYCVFYLTAGLTTTFTTSERILVTINGEGDAWIYADPLCAQLENVVTILNHQLAEEGYSMAWPAMMPEVISVGNIAYRFKIVTMANKYASQGGVVTPTDITDMESTKGEGYLAKSSSVGPTLTGAVKPDVCAPGVNIVSAENFFIDDDTYYSVAGWDIAALDTEYETWDGVSGYFHIMAQTGTSMSAPAVTGTIALWLQADPTLTTERIKDVIAHSSRQPDDELSYPNNQYGYGEIDAYRGLLYILNLTGIRDLSQHQPQQARVSLIGKRLNVSFANDYEGPVTVRVFSTDGRLLLTSSDTNIGLERLSHGVYAVQVTTGEKSTTGSTLIRL